MSATATSFGNATALRDDAARLRRRAEAAEDLAAVAARADVGRWSGEACDAYLETLAGVVRDLRRAADDSVDAATVLDGHADTITWADDRLASAVPATAWEADALLEDVRDAVDGSAERAASALQAITDRIDRLPPFWSAVIGAHHQYYLGMAEGTVAMIEGWWQFSAVRFISDPDAVISDGVAVATGLYTGLREDPEALVKAMVDYDTWRTEPFRAAGRLVPDLIIVGATAGGGAAASAGLRGSRFLRTVAGERDSPTAQGPSASREPGHGDHPEEEALDVEPRSMPTFDEFLRDPEALRGAAWEDVRQLVPETWNELPLKKGEGVRFLNPERLGEAVMLERGVPDASDLLHFGPYLRVSRDGETIRVPLAGNPDLEQ
ncbi:putative T7SS-secreted protein [Actinotalea sp. JY-7885]|uniref:putative T7SS-secreted protein n=1 Tax=Actinotalea sp. JY-7885 TaxID=2758576 RepID=UPI00165E0323|nr:hypothetical protein [Actinotalea sp. JY-7885]